MHIDVGRTGKEHSQVPQGDKKILWDVAEIKNPAAFTRFCQNGSYWIRTSDPLLVRQVL